MPNPHIPGGSFDACVVVMQGKGNSEDSAKRICGSLQAKSENMAQDFKLTDEEKKVVEEFGGEGSGNFGHEGRPGEVGGSGGGGAGNKGGESYLKDLDKANSSDDWEKIAERAKKDKNDKLLNIAGRLASRIRFGNAVSQDELDGAYEAAGEKFTKEVKVFTELEAEIFAVGQWNKDKYSVKNLQEMVNNFNELKDIVKPPAKIGHSESQDYLKKEGLPAAGWVNSLKMVGNKVVAHFKDVPKIVKDLIDKKAYKRVSAEIYPTYKNPANGKIYNNVLRAVAFLGAETPAIESLSDILSRYTDDNQFFKVYTIDINDFKKKKPIINFIDKKYTIKVQEIK